MVLASLGLLFAGMQGHDQPPVQNRMRRPRSKPSRLARTPALAAQLARDFECAAGTCALEDAQVVGLGEMRLDPTRIRQQKPEEVAQGFRSTGRISRLLAAVTQPGDLLLVEGQDRSIPERPVGRIDPVARPALMQVHQRGLKLRGWDAAEHASLPGRTAAQLDHKLQLRHRDGLYPTLMEEVRRTQRRIFLLCGAAHLTTDPRLDELLEQREIPYLFLVETEAAAFARANDLWRE